MSDSRVVVVGTTSDYIEMIRRRFPGRAVFLTDRRERMKALEPVPHDSEELLCDLGRPDLVVTVLHDHLKRRQIVAGGVVCYDCETMALASFVARELSLPFVSPEAVATCRSKFLSKEAWRRAKLPCPEAQLVHSEAEATDFLQRTKAPAVLKPLTGSGSELVFVCRDDNDCTSAYRTTRSRLAEHPNKRMYAGPNARGNGHDPRQVLVIEELICGTEYSCDFIVDGTRVEIIRIARKIPAPGQPLGTILAYLLPEELPPDFDRAGFVRQLQVAAESVGIDRAICMLDFIVRDGEAVMIEMAPRLGGDCLPYLIRQSSGLDVLGLSLDFAEGRTVTIPGGSRWKQLVGLRLFAPHPGVISAIDPHLIDQDRRVLECYLKRHIGHRVVMPPADYDSRILGHVVFEPTSLAHLESECLEIAAKLRLEMETSPCETPIPS